MKILLIEDDADIASNISQYLEAQGHILDFAYQGDKGLELALATKFDLIILDLLLPLKDGIDVLKEYREQSQAHTPIIILTARDTLDDKLIGFDAGADDYLVKPFSLLELNARINSLVKRTNHKVEHQDISISDLALNPSTLSVIRSNVEINLKPMAFKILHYLMTQTNRVVTRKELLEHIWQDDLPEGDPLRVHIHNLRQHVDKPFETQLIHTIHGVGYRVFNPKS